MSDSVHMELVCRAGGARPLWIVPPAGFVFLVNPLASYAHASKLEEMTGPGMRFSSGTTMPQPNSMAAILPRTVRHSTTSRSCGMTRGRRLP